MVSHSIYCNYTHYNTYEYNMYSYIIFYINGMYIIVIFTRTVCSITVTSRGRGCNANTQISKTLAVHKLSEATKGLYAYILRE